ncbi:MAG: acetylxylan esterase, partial [Verrucomicrobia bacterium]|nr:acetylxylan esterase [Verrucomicrobiota bacterium]
MTAGLCLAAGLTVSAQQPRQPNYDESKVGNHPLPDPLTCADGLKVTDARTWQTKRRAEIFQLF